MIDFSLFRPQMEIVGSDGQHVGAALRHDGERVYLAEGGPDEAPAPSIPGDLIDAIDVVIRLNQPAREVIEAWLGRTSPAADSGGVTD